MPMEAELVYVPRDELALGELVELEFDHLGAVLGFPSVGELDRCFEGDAASFKLVFEEFVGGEAEHELYLG